MQTACLTNSTDNSERQSAAIYDAGCELGELIDLLDTTADALEESRVVPTCDQLRRCASLVRIARRHAANTLATILAAEESAE